MKFNDDKADKGVAVRTRWSQSTVDLRNELKGYAKKYSWLTYDPDFEADAVVAKKLKSDKKKILAEASKRGEVVEPEVNQTSETDTGNVGRTVPGPASGKTTDSTDYDSPPAAPDAAGKKSGIGGLFRTS